MNQKMKGVISLLTTILTLYGCGSSKIQYPEPAVDAKNGSFVSEERTFEFGDKEYKADYGTVTVMENRHNPDSRLIHLPVLRIHARSENSREPVFCFAGGPGQSNMEFNPVDTLLYNHDCVLIGYRGVDGSTVLDCPEVKEAIEDNDDLLSEQSIKKLAQAWEASTNRFKAMGIDLNCYTMPETLEDFETVRKVFNYDKINLISESYGTRLAYLYGVIHPQNINRTIMIGVNQPGGFVYNAKITDEQIRYYSRLWAKDSVMVKKCPDLAVTMQNVLNNMPRKWFLFSINPGKVRAVTLGMLYHRNSAAMVFDSYVAAANGDNSGLALMSMAFNYVFPDMFVWGDVAAKAVSADLNYWHEETSENKNDDKILGSPFNELYWKPLKYMKFPIDKIPDSLVVPVKSDAETLLLSGSVDFANPAENAKAFLPYLKNGKHVIISEAGHVGDIRYMQRDAVKGLVADYINEGIVDTSKIKYVPMDFNVSMGFPKIAKASIAIVGVLTVLLTAGIIFLVK